MGLVNSTTPNNFTISDSRGGGIQGSGQVKMYNTIIANSVTGTDCAATNVILAEVNDLIEYGSCVWLLVAIRNWIHSRITAAAHRPWRCWQVPRPLMRVTMRLAWQPINAA